MHQPVASFWCVLIPKCQLACELHQASWTKHTYLTQTAKANPLCQDVISVQRAQGAELHTAAATRVPETGGHLPVSAATKWTSWTWKHRIPASPPWAVGWVGHGSLEGFFIILFFYYYFISSRLWNDEAFSSGWCLLGLTGAVLPCALTGEVAEFSTWGCMVHDLKDRKEGELGYFQVCWPHSVANEGN